MPKFRKKPVVIEAHQLPALDQEPTEELINFLPFNKKFDDWEGGVTIETSRLGWSSYVHGDPEDWIVKDDNGEFRAYGPVHFQATYEPVEEPDNA